MATRFNVERGHDHAGLQKPHCNPLMLLKGRLHGMQLSILGQPFGWSDVLAVSL